MGYKDMITGKWIPAREQADEKKPEEPAEYF
jgi:hypothetical protein